MAQMTIQQRAISLVSGLFFLGSLAVTAATVYKEAIASPQPAASLVAEQQAQETEKDALKAQAEGYALVLQREPNNQTALEGLAKAQLDLGNKQAAIAPLEKLVQLHPDRVDYQALLKAAKQGSTP